MSNRQSLTYAGFGLQCHTCTYSGPGQFNLSRTNNNSATYKVSCANCWSKEGEAIIRKKKAAELRAALKALAKPRFVPIEFKTIPEAETAEAPVAAAVAFDIHDIHDEADHGLEAHAN